MFTYLLERIKEFFRFGKVRNLFNARILRRRRPGTVIRPPQQPQVTNAPVDYFLNDPTTSNLMVKLPIPTPPNEPKFTVKNFQGGGFAYGTEPSLAACAYVTITNVLNFYRAHTDKPIQRWPGVSTLSVIPNAGIDLNAYYNRNALKFFNFNNAKTGAIYTAYSADVVAHELGHAILDSYRPDTWSAASLEVYSFHEAFGDFTALVYSLTHKEVIDFVLQQTGGNLKQLNISSNLAESIGRAIAILAPGQSNPNYLRCAINPFKYINPATLPSDGPDGQLTNNPHIFGLIFLGALYDILTMIYEDGKTGGLKPISALIYARDLILKYMLIAIQNAPLNVKFFESMARTILWADYNTNASKYHDRMRAIFLDRKILPNEVRMLSVAPLSNQERLVKTEKKMILKLGDHLLRAQADNELYNVEVEIPHDEAYFYDNDGNCIDLMKVSEEESLVGAQDMIIYLHQAKKVSDDPKTPFEIQNGKLVRTHFD